MDFEPTEIIEETTSQQSQKIIKWAISTALIALTILLCGGFIGYYAFNQIIGQLDEGDLAELTAPLFAGRPTRNQIAYIGNDRNVWRVTPDGTDPYQITVDSKGYRFPTWAPDSRRVAFIGPEGDNRSVLYISPAAESAPSVLFEDKDAAPFYLYWAPDSQSITFLTQEASGLSMRQANVNNPTKNRILEEGAPFYWVWSPSGDRLLMHVGGSRGTSAEAHISLLDNKEEANRVQLNLEPGGFQAPLWSADGSHFFFIAAADNKKPAIYKTEAETLSETKVTDLDGFAYMILALDGEHIAYLQIERGNRPPFGTAYLISTSGEDRKKLTDRLVGSMYWSPDGNKLAVLTLAESDDGSTAKVGGQAAPLPQELTLRWWIYEVAADKLDPLISFTPTGEFLQTVPYFDQYHLSLTFWSPDSRYLVLTKSNASGPGGTVWVVDTSGEEEPQQVGEGTIAVWSWQ